MCFISSINVTNYRKESNVSFLGAATQQSLIFGVEILYIFFSHLYLEKCATDC